MLSRIKTFKPHTGLHIAFQFVVHKFIVFTLILIQSTCLWAVQLYKVQTDHPQFQFLVPAKDNETAAEAVDQFKKSILNSPELSPLYQDFELEDFKISYFDKLTTNTKISRVLALANRGYDISSQEKKSSQKRLDQFYKKLGPQVELLVLPLGITARFSQNEVQEIMKNVGSNFSALLALGGADIDPHLYSEENTDSIGVNPLRDQLEIQIIQAWIKMKSGLLFGVCRGHQLIAAALGFKLTQHIENHGQNEMKKHAIKFQPTKNKFFENLFPKQTKIVNSYHHQAVLTKDHPDIEIAAMALDGTVEALESKDGSILTTQFHYEFMGSEASKNIFRAIKEKIHFFSNRKCVKLFH